MLSESVFYQKLLLCFSLLSLLLFLSFIIKCLFALQEDDVLNLAPKKPHADLQRAIEKKLKKLDKRTQKALAALARKS